MTFSNRAHRRLQIARIDAALKCQVDHFVARVVAAW
jgi:hypothetical protein